MASFLAGGSHNSKVGVVVGSIGGAAVFIVIGVVFVFCKGRKKGNRREVFVDVPGLSSNCLIVLPKKTSENSVCCITNYYCSSRFLPYHKFLFSTSWIPMYCLRLTSHQSFTNEISMEMNKRMHLVLAFSPSSNEHSSA